MSAVNVKIERSHGEPIDSVIRKFRKEVEKANVMQEYRKHEQFKPKGQRRREKSAIARKRLLKAGLA